MNAPSAAEVKACCASLYGAPWARLLLGDSFHPGGAALTERLGELMRLAHGQLVLDVAAGDGSSSQTLSRRFGCSMVGVDLGAGASAGAFNGLSLVRGDGECLPVRDESFDALVCECSFCLFPDKATAAGEFARALRPGGWIGISDVTRQGPLPEGLDSIGAWVACLADARPSEEYVALLETAGLRVRRVEPRGDVLRTLIQQVRGRLTAAAMVAKLGLVSLDGLDLGLAQELARLAANAVDDGALGYTLIVGSKEGQWRG